MLHIKTHPSCATPCEQVMLHVAVPFTPGNGVLTPTQSNMAVLWHHVQPATPMTPCQPTPLQYPAVPMPPGWQMVCSWIPVPDAAGILHIMCKSTCLLEKSQPLCVLLTKCTQTQHTIFFASHAWKAGKEHVLLISRQDLQ
jgi:hypothetical protein